MLSALWILSHLVAGLDGESGSGERLAYAAQWNAVAAIPLFMAIIAVGNERFKGPGIDPISGQQSREMMINGRVVDNTVQQYALFATASFAVAAGASGDQVATVGAAAILFVFMRLAFWIGYRIDPLYRAFGMGGTMYLNLLLFGYAAWLA